METTKSKTTSKTKKTAKAGEPVKKKKTTTRKATVRKSEPSEEEIRSKANEVYLQRIAQGEVGTAMDDWNKAIELLKNSRKVK
jgi:hypothetical protein